MAEAEQILLTADEELELALQMIDGKREGLFRLLEAFGPRVKWLLLHKLGGVLSEDDIDSVLLLAAEKAFAAAGKFDERRCKMGGWFYTIAYRTAIDRFRRVGDKSTVSLEDDPPAPVEAEANVDFGIDPVHADLRACVSELGELQRKIIEADILAGGPVDAEVLSKRLGIPKQSVYSYRNKAHQALLKRMNKRGHSAETIGSQR